MQLDLPQAAVVREVLVRFQGGFAGKECHLIGNSDSGGVMAHIHTFHADDNSSLQVQYLMMALNRFRALIPCSHCTLEPNRATLYDQSSDTTEPCLAQFSSVAFILSEICNRAGPVQF